MDRSDRELDDEIRRLNGLVGGIKRLSPEGERDPRIPPLREQSRKLVLERRWRRLCADVATWPELTGAQRARLAAALGTDDPAAAQPDAASAA